MCLPFHRASHTLHRGGMEKRTLSRLVDSLADFTPEPWDNYTRTEREENLKKCRLVLARM